MANRSQRNPLSASGDWYVDTRCIDCAASREVAPGLIVEREGQSVFARQPVSEQDRHAAWRAALLCPTASIGHAAAPPPADLFPQPIGPGVYRCGYNALASFGAHSYFVQRSDGNVLIDSPRYVQRLVQAFTQTGGLAEILLTHQDDIADAARYAQHFGARVWIHSDDRAAVPFATDLFEGERTHAFGEDLLAIPLPGHTRGSVAYLWRQQYLFSGDSLAWDRASSELTAFRDYCWYSWDALKHSLEQLTQHRFEWLLPGHGHSVRLDVAMMQRELRGLLQRM